MVHARILDPHLSDPHLSPFDAYNHDPGHVIPESGPRQQLTYKTRKYFTLVLRHDVGALISPGIHRLVLNYFGMSTFLAICLTTVCSQRQLCLGILQLLVSRGLSQAEVCLSILYMCA